MKRKMQIIVLQSIFEALICMTTLIITIPLPTKSGYINLGDSLILTISTMFGAMVGSFSGAIGSSIADLILAPIYAPFTFFIKFFEGFICGIVNKKNINNSFFIRLIGAFLGTLIMISGYFLVELFLFDFNTALINLTYNLIQAGVSIVLYLLLSKIFLTLKLKNHNNK